MNKYSIILPVRNGGAYFRQCVESILSQSYRDFNLHVLDNCSTDGSLEWIRSVRDDRIVIIESGNPLTIEESWHRIVDMEKNEYITLIGHDDLLHENYLSVMDHLIASFPDASLFQTHFNIIDEEGKEIKKCKPMAQTENAGQFLQSVFTNRFDVFGTGFMMRSRDYDSVGGIPLYPNLLFADFELWTRLTGLSYKATASEECFSYRLHLSTTKVSPDIKMHQAFSRFINYLSVVKSEDAEIDRVIRQFGLQFLYTYCKGLSHRLIRTPLKRRQGLTVRSFVRSCKEYADRLVPGNNFDPDSVKSIRAAEFIDSNGLTRNLFLLFKKFYPKPVLK